MVDEEVEKVLREIRERVRAEQQMHARTPVTLTMDERPPDDSRVESNAEFAPLAADALARIEAHLTTTARAWDRLPPIVSHRRGWLARLELWLKRRFKSATRWYAWEQINFNASVHHALGNTLEVLAAYERQLAGMRDEMRAEIEARRTEIEARRTEIEAQKNDLMARLSAMEEQLRDEARSLDDSLRREEQAHTAALQRELRERDEHLRDEARVSFRQLSLEAGEAAVMQDRARRQLEARLEKLEGAKAVASDK